MFSKFLAGGALLVFVAGPVSALTMTPLSDFRMTSAEAQAGFDTDSQSDAPGPGFPAFASESSATASEGFEDEDTFTGDAGFFGGAFADANARQSTSLGSLSISGSGSANASGNHGVLAAVTTGDAADSGDLEGDFHSSADSTLEIIFSIDESAAFDLDGFLTAGLLLESDSGLSSNVIQSARVFLGHNDTKTTVFQTEVINGELQVDETGILDPGSYIFSVSAYAEVFGGFLNQVQVLSGDAGTLAPFGYSTNASFQEFSLVLTEIDKPIPEPVTTVLIGMGLGALCLSTSRRRG